MRIEHLIDGKPAPRRDYFETVNPATQEVLAEVARGGEAEVDAAVRAAKEAFPAWAGKPAAERAKLMRKLGDLIAKNVPGAFGDRDAATPARRSRRRASSSCRAPPTTSTTSPRCARASTATPIRRDTHLNYTLFHPVGVCALISPWNVPFMTATWKVAPCLAFGNTAVLKMSELSPLTAARLGELALGGRHSGRRAERRARLRQGSRRAARRAPRRARRSRSPARRRPATASCRAAG